MIEASNVPCAAASLVSAFPLKKFQPGSKFGAKSACCGSTPVSSTATVTPAPCVRRQTGSTSRPGIAVPSAAGKDGRSQYEQLLPFASASLVCVCTSPGEQK